jgi:hypothetical protein
MAASKSIVELLLFLLLTGFLALLSRFFDLRFDGVAEVIGADGLARHSALNSYDDQLI